MNGLQIVVICFIVLIVLAAILFITGKKKLGLVKKINQIVLITSLICACVLFLLGIGSFVRAKQSETVVSFLTSNEVEKIYSEGKISSEEYRNYKNGNCEISEQRNSCACWFIKTTSYKAVYN